MLFTLFKKALLGKLPGKFRGIIPRSSTIIIATLIATCLAVIDSPKAGETDCFGLNPFNNCGGPSWYIEARRCYPKVTFLQPKIDSVWTTILNPSIDTAFQVHVRFCVGVGGQGFNTTGGSNGLVVTVFAEDPTGHIEDITGCSQTGTSTDFECVECSHDCSLVTMSLNVGRTSGLINFWAKASQRGEEGFDICACTSDTIPVYVTDQSVPDTLPLPLPLPEEFGPMACESQVGDPINVTNGNLYLERLDIAVPSDLGPSMDFVRYYNSYDTAYTSLFRNWRHSFEYSLDSIDSQTYQLIEATGRRVNFTKTTLSSGTDHFVTYTPSYGVHYRLSISGSPAVYTVTREDDSKLLFQSLGKIDFIEDRAGNRISLFYSFQTLDSVKNASGRLLRFEYGLFDRMSGVFDSDNRQLLAFVYAPGGGGVPGSGTLDEVQYLDSTTTFEHYTYGSGPANQFHVTEITSSDAPTRTYLYDASGRAIQYSRAGNAQQVSLSWSVNQTTCPDTIKCTTVSANGTAQRNSFWSPDYSKRMVVYTDNSDCADCATTFSYDGGGLKQTVVYPPIDGRVDSMYYDLRGNLIRQVKAATSSLKQATTISYHGTFNLPLSETYQSVANTGRTAGRLWNYDVNGNIQSTLDCGWLNSSDSFTYITTHTTNTVGQIIKIDGPRTDVVDTTGFQYHSTTHDLQEIHLANGDIYSIGARDVLGRPTIVVGPNGDTTKFVFDIRGRLKEITRQSGTADAATTKYTYNVDGDVTSTTDALNSTLTIHRDAAGNVDKITDPLNNYLQYGFDLSGNIRSAGIYAANGTRRSWKTFGYDTRYRMVADTNAYNDKQQFGYAPAGMLNSYINGRQFETKYLHDTLHRLTSVTEMNGADSALTRYFYNAHDDLIKVIDPDGWANVSYYDDLGRVVRDSSGATTIDSFKYDPADNLTNWKNASDGITYTYDALNRLIQKRANTADTVKYQYDGTEYAYGKGRLYKTINRTCTTKYRYDYAGRLFKEYRQLAGTSTWDSTAYTYDKNDNVLTITYPTGRRVQYTRNALGQITKVEIDIGSGWTTVANNIAYAPFGPVTSLTYGNGVPLTVGIDSAYRTRGISTYPDTLARFTYLYDAAGNITTSLDSVGGFDSLRYTYDGLDRVKSSSSQRFGDTLQQYTYTPNGNITKIKRYHPAIDSFMLSYSANRLGGVSGADVYFYQHDRFGNVIRQVHGTQPPPPPGGGAMMSMMGPSGPDTTHYYHSLWGTFDSIRYRGTVQARYYYDGSGQRVKKISGATTIFGYDLSGRLLSEVRVGGDTLDYAYLNGVPIARYSSNPSEGMQYIHSDQIGAPIAMANSSKTLTWKARYYPYGLLRTQMVSATNNLRLPGQYYDGEFGFHQNGYRSYHPLWSRYWSADPIGLAGGTNRYEYASGNPLLNIDPFGLDDSYSWAELLEDIGQSIVGFGDASSSGLTKWIRSQDWYGGDAFTQQDSRAYFVGEVVSAFFPSPGGKTRVATCALSGQKHHAISKAIFDALQRHDILRNIYKLRDSRFVTQARDRLAHIGYQTWHRLLDKQVARWIAKHPDATQVLYEQYMKRRYRMPDLRWRFPKGL